MRIIDAALQLDLIEMGLAGSPIATDASEYASTFCFRKVYGYARAVY